MTTRRCGSGKSQSPWKTSQFLRTFTNRDFSHCKPHTNSCKIHDTTWKEWNYQGTISNYDPLPHVPWLESRFNTKFYIVRNVIKDIFIPCTPGYKRHIHSLHTKFHFTYLPNSQSQSRPSSLLSETEWECKQSGCPSVIVEIFCQFTHFVL